MSLPSRLTGALADRYELLRELGAGGMATVYLARDMRHNRQVALKVLHPELSAVLGPERFLKEIELTASLQHPHILPLFDSGEAGGQLFYVMPYVEGETLRGRLDRETQLPIADAVQLAREVAGALQYAHERGVIHRDIKPENILLQGAPGDQHALVADFGIALAVQQAGGARMTQTGLSLGTPQYMAPEQAMGEKTVDARADIYALGAVTYEMLAGEPPFSGATSQAIVARVLTVAPAPLTETRATVPDAVEHAVLAALAKLPADRPPTARAFAEALLRDPPPGTDQRATTRAGSAAAPPASRSRRIAQFGGWVAAAILACSTGWLATRTPSAPPAVHAEFEVDLPDSLSPVPNGSNASLAFTPDGNTLVFQASPASGSWRLFSRRLDARDLSPIAGSEGASAPVFSPDGRTLLFSRGEGAAEAAVQLIPLVGGTARTVVASAVANGQWSWIDRERLLVSTTTDLAIVAGERGAPVVLARPDAARRHLEYGWPHVLPGGKAALITIARGRRLRDSLQLGVVTIPEGVVTELNIRASSPLYSLGHLLYVTSEGILQAVPFDPAARRVFGSPLVVAEGVRTSIGRGGASAVAVSATGTLAWLSGGPAARSGVDVVAVNRQGVIRSLGVPPGDYRHPRVAPDGQQIALTVTDTRGGTDVWRFRIGEPTLQRVTTEGADRPEWLDDASLLVSRTVADSIVYRAALAPGSTLTPWLRVPAPRVTSGDPGPRGGYTAFTVQNAAGDSLDLWIAHRDSLDAPRAFRAAAYHEVLPAVSPDGKWLAFSSGRTGGGELYVADLPIGREELRVSERGGNDPVWSRDGRELFYRDRDSLYVATLAAAPLRVTARRALFALRGFQDTDTRTVFDVFPDGRFLMLAQLSSDERRRPRLLVRTNWLESLRRQQAEAK